MAREFPNDRDLAERLQKLLKAEPWVGMALIYMLTPEQWQALRSQGVFTAMRDHLVRIAKGATVGQKMCFDSPGDIANYVLGRLPETDWLKGFIASMGSPTGYFKGTCRFQTRDVVRSRLRIKNRRLATLPDEIVERVGSKVENRLEQQESIEKVKQLSLQLPDYIRESFERTYPALATEPSGSTLAPTKRDRAYSKIAITNLRRMLQLAS